MSFSEFTRTCPNCGDEDRICKCRWWDAVNAMEIEFTKQLRPMCPNCGSRHVNTRWERSENLDYVQVPVRACSDCRDEWYDWESTEIEEQAREIGRKIGEDARENLLKAIDPTWVEDFIHYVWTGSAAQGFIEYLNKSEECQKTLEEVMGRFREALKTKNITFLPKDKNQTQDGEAGV